MKVFLIFWLFYYSAVDHISAEPIYPVADLESIKSMTVDQTIGLPDPSLLISTEPNYLAAKSIPVYVRSGDFRLAHVTAKGDKIFRYVLSTSSISSLRFGFEDLYLDPQTNIYTYSDLSEIPQLANKENIDGQIYTSTLLRGNKFIIEYIESKESRNTQFEIRSAYYHFKSSSASSGFGKAQPCMVNVACPEGDSFKLEAKAVCKVNVITTIGIAECTGTMINNVKNDGTPYILTANSCTSFLSAADIRSWEFLFDYQSVTCDNPMIEPRYITLTGAEIIARGMTDHIIGRHDFILVKHNKPLPLNIEFAFLGWDFDYHNVPTSGVGIHHTEGDIKKIATFSKAIFNRYGPFSCGNCFLRADWDSTVSGFSTAYHALGSPLLNEKRLLEGIMIFDSSNCMNRSLSRQSDHYFNFAIIMEPSSDIKDSSIKIRPWLGLHNMPYPASHPSIRYTRKASASILMNDLDLEPTLFMENRQLWIKAQEKMNHVTISNIEGRIVYQSKDNNDQKIDLNSLNTGLYILRIADRHHRQFQKKFMLN